MTIPGWLFVGLAVYGLARIGMALWKAMTETDSDRRLRKLEEDLKTYRDRESRKRR